MQAKISVFFMMFFTSQIYFLPQYSKGQNLVPNPSFEDTIACPNSWTDSSYKAAYWKNFGNTPDYFNSCANPTPPSLSVPFNGVGYQFPLDGSAYAGVINYEDSLNYKEFIGSQLSTPLIIGEKYYVSLNISLAYDGSVIHCGSNGMGIKLSTIEYSKTNSPPLNNAFIYTTSIVYDTSNWTFVSGSFISDSTYTYVILGNFFNDSSIIVQSIDSNPYCGIVYYYIDNICISTDSLTCASLGISENNEKNLFTVFPNPINKDYLNIKTISLPFDVEIFNSLGQLVYLQKNILSNNITIDAKGINSNILLVKFFSKNQSYNYKLIKL